MANPIKKSRVVFAGGKHIGVAILDYLVKKENITGVVANKGTPSVKPIVEQDGLNFIDLKRAEGDILVVAYFDKIIPQKILNKFKTTVNVHLGLVQDYRGCYPTAYPIIDDRDYVGVTLHKITKTIDGGDVYAQSGIPTNPHDTAETLYFKLTGIAYSLFVDNWEKIKKGKTYSVPIHAANYHTREDLPPHDLTPFVGDPEEFDRFKRAITFRGFPKPYVIINNTKLEIDTWSQ